MGLKEVRGARRKIYVFERKPRNASGIIHYLVL
jgi:hypothetical protein